MKIFNATLITGLSLLSLFSFSAVTSAAVVQSLTLPLSFAHETNPRYSTTNKQSINRTTLTPQYSIRSNSESNQWFSTASLSLVRTSDQKISQDRDDPSLNLGWTHSYETGQFSVTGLINEQSTQVSELTDSGIITGDNTKKLRTVSMNWRNSLSERTSLTLGGRAEKSSFDGIGATSLVGFQSESSNVSLNYSLTEQTELFTQLSYSRNKPESSTSISNTKSINFGATWRVSDKTSTTLSVGGNETDNNNSVSQNWQASINSRYATPRTNTQFSLSRSQSPSSLGGFNESQQFALVWSYSLSERDNIGLNASWRENLSLNTTQTKQFSVNYSHVLNLNWDLSLSATHNTREDNLTNASSSSIMASIVYKLPDY